jgi:VanZ family protein
MYAPPLLWSAFIFFLSSQSNLPGFPDSLAEFIFKKTSHMFVYGVLYLFVLRATKCSKNSYISKKSWLLAFLYCFCFAISDELHQIFTPNRTPALRDIGFDMIGSSIAFLMIYQYI